ncbi:unnamed protein product [Rhizophagus irregularis]|uniref:Uncharacterized protein n=1 Tax=Rhizophagus irregularis TaxID=588596 RepID=A0A2I1FZV6_9GLOM|nr:hypothetical protein RhiirA4_394032 [Rhizophagus irregularis]CAB4429707.1 unnamed protein product [Rhizophagus irregularis]
MRYNKIFTIFPICLIYFLLYTVIASPISLPEFDLENIEKAATSAPTTSAPSSSSSSSPSAAIAVFTNPSNSSTAVTGQIKFTKTSQNKTNVSGKLDSGIFDKVAANYQFKIVDRSKILIYDLTTDGLNKWSVVNSTGTTPFQHDFDKLLISKIVDQFFEISHHKKGIVSMTIVKSI